MPPKKEKKYLKRVNSNGENVAPTICSTIAKLPQQQAAYGGGYVLEYFKKDTTKAKEKK